MPALLQFEERRKPVGIKRTMLRLEQGSVDRRYGWTYHDDEREGDKEKWEELHVGDRLL